ncbi:MAG: EAL domain-containing protein [Xenococcaceae cyanobacterium]
MLERSEIPQQKKQVSQFPLHLLIVEDVPEDAELIAITLETADVTFTYDIAQTAIACQQLLQENTYDAVLSDYHMPEFNGLQVLEFLQKSGQEIPLILVTGALGEEAAVECIKIGMTDYVLKDRLFRLPTVLERSLQEFELRRQQKAAIAQIKQQAWRESIINRIVQAMRETLILDEVLQTTVDQLHEALQVSRCLIFQPDPNKKMRAKYISEATAERESLIGVYCDFYGYYQDTLARGEQVVHGKIDDRLAPEIQEAVKKFGIRSIMITPLFYQQSYLGGISLHQCDEEREWTENELVLVKAIADHCAIAIHQAELYQQAQSELAERKRAESAWYNSEQRFQALIENATDIIVILDAQGLFRYVSPSAKRILGYTLEDTLGKRAFEFAHPDDEPLMSENLKSAIQNPGISQPAVEYRIRHRNGSWYFLEAVATNLLDHPAVKGIVLNCHDITKRKKVEEQLRYDAFHDALTGLPNRALFMDRLEQAINRRKRQKDNLFAVLFLDLDRFKVINDSLGHPIGNQLLIAIARRLEKCRRAGDTVARFGGDEFVILLENITSINDAIKVAERIHRALKPPINLDGHERFITTSIGIVLSSASYNQPDQLLRDADAAMYYAKARNQACHEVFDPSMHTQALRRLHLESDLRRALEHQELVVYYQPIFSLETNCLQGFEALVRWQHPERGIVSPDEFIPIAEETGLIVSIDQWVLQEACRQLRLWQEHFPVISPLTISVNLSGKQFSQPDLIQQIDQVLQETSLDGRYLKLEITESVLIKNANSATLMLTHLRARNIQVCIDDFGTGYSSLSYLHRFPTNILKIDRSFMNVKCENFAIVRTIAIMAHDLGIRLIAEGVETAEQLEELKRLGCHSGQGYWFSEPLDSEEATTWLKNKLLVKVT